MTGTQLHLPLAVTNLTHRFLDRDAAVTAVDDVTFKVADGELYTLLGPSGCGKTTTLRSVAGLEHPDHGQIVLDGTVASDGDIRHVFVPPHRRNIGMVFQNYGIWPHLTVFENAAFPLRVSRLCPRERELRRRVEEALATVQLAGYEGRMATALSGGQQQRLALARAIVRRPKLLLLDEPLSHLDARLREAMRAELASLQRQLGITTLYVTHDQTEALNMSDRIAVMADGRIVQEGRPREIYQHPRTRFVAEFLGTTNILPGTVRDIADGRACVDSAIGPLLGCAIPEVDVGAPVVVVIRPEQARLHLDQPDSAENLVKGKIGQSEFLGDHVDCSVRIGDHRLVIRTETGPPAATGEQAWVQLPVPALTIIPADRPGTTRI